MENAEQTDQRVIDLLKCELRAAYTARIVEGATPEDLRTEMRRSLERLRRMTRPGHQEQEEDPPVGKDTSRSRPGPA